MGRGRITRRRRAPQKVQDGRRRAVVLSYDPDSMQAPEVSASGQGLVADRIIALAKENNVPVREDPALASLLSQLEVGEIIPPQLYGAVAEVLAFVYRLEGRKLDSS